MTRDDIIRMAVECQLMTTGNRDGVYATAIERFAGLVAGDGRELIGLTDEEIDAVTDTQWASPLYAAHRAYARAIEAKLKAKNTC